MFVHLKPVFETLLWYTFHNKMLQPLLTLLWLFSQVSFTPFKETNLSIQPYPGIIYYSMSDTECFILRRHMQGFHSLVSYRLKKLNKQTQKKPRKPNQNNQKPTKPQKKTHPGKVICCQLHTDRLVNMFLLIQLQEKPCKRLKHSHICIRLHTCCKARGLQDMYGTI